MHRRFRLHENFNAVDDERISQKFSNYNAYDGYGNVRAHQAEYYCYAFADNRKKGEKAHPCATAGMNRLALSSSFLFTCRYFSIQSMRPSMPMP